MRASLRIAVALTLGLLTAGAALGDQESERLYSLGLVEFHADRFPQALDLFERAVKADPGDPYARYYRGVTEGRLGKYDAAVADLEAALRAKPDLPQAPLELGVALVQDGKNSEAIPWLEKAQGVPDLEAEASLFLGIAELRLGKYAAADQNLERSAKGDPALELAARYYQGVVSYQQQSLAAAKERFEFVVDTRPDSDMGREARVFLDRIRDGGDPLYQLYGEFGLQYDSNLGLTPSSNAIKSALGIVREDDGRAVFTAGGVWAPVRRDDMRLSLGYEIFQGLQFQHSSFNLQNHRPNLQFAMAAGPARFGLYARYDYYLQQTDSFLQDFIVTPWVAMLEQSWGRTDVFFRSRIRDFYASPYRGLLDGYNFSPGIRQMVYFGGAERYLSIAYRFDRQESEFTQGDAFAYDGNGVALALGWDLPFDVLAQVGYTYRHQGYDSASQGRKDNDNRFSVVAERPITSFLDVIAGFYGAVHDSNQPEFEYDRYIGSIGVRARY